MAKHPKIGDTIQHTLSFINVVRVGTVDLLLSAQFGYVDDLGNRHLCMYDEDWVRLMSGSSKPTHESPTTTYGWPEPTPGGESMKVYRIDYTDENGVDRIVFAGTQDKYSRELDRLGAAVTHSGTVNLPYKKADLINYLNGIFSHDDQETTT